jgi:nitroreductase
MSKLNADSLAQLFTEARSFNSFQPKPVSDETLREIYDLLKWGPTSANLCPARIVFVKEGTAKEKFLSCVSPMNVDKVKSAPVTAVIAMDEKFYDQTPKLLPETMHKYREMFASNAALAEATAFRNGSLQGAYFILAARALGLDCGPMSGFDNKKLDELFFAGTSWKSNFICNLGYGDRSKIFPRLNRLSFDEACKII